MSSDVVVSLYRLNKRLSDNDGRAYDATECRDLIHEITAGLDRCGYNKLIASIRECDNTISDVIRTWYTSRLLPENTWYKVYEAYYCWNYNKALWLLLTSYGNVYIKGLLITDNPTMTVEDVEEYTRYIPNETLKSLVERLMMYPKFGKDDVLTKKRSLKEWFEYCAKYSWLSFEPYVYEAISKAPRLVLKYNRVIMFDGSCWGVYTSDAINSNWYMGYETGFMDLDTRDIEFASRVLWAGLIQVGCRMSEFVKLLANNTELIESFIYKTVYKYDIKVVDEGIRNSLNIYMKVANNISKMGYRIVRDDVTEYARIGASATAKYIVEVPYGITVKTVVLDFCAGGIDSFVKNEANCVSLLLSGCLALMGILIDDRYVYSMDKDAVLRSDSQADLIPIRNIKDLMSAF